MREIKYKGKTAYISEADWRNLLRRFDAKNAKQEYNRRFYIAVGCNLCKKHRPHGLLSGCGNCPLTVFRTSAC